MATYLYHRSALNIVMFELNEGDVDHSVFFSAELAKQTLFMAAFPLLTTLYGYRGLNGPITPSKTESKLAKLLKISPETLNEAYSLLVPFGYLVTKNACNLFGVVAMFWAGHVGLQDPRPEDIASFMSKTGVVADSMSWISGLAGLAALGIWTRRRQQRRTKDMWTVGVPEVALAAFVPVFYISTAVPCSEHYMDAIKTYYRV